jgi:hypothetical protein
MIEVVTALLIFLSSVFEFGPRSASSGLDVSFCAQRLLQDSEGRSRRCHPGDTIQCLLRNDNPAERGLCAAWVRQHGLDPATIPPARPTMSLNHAGMRVSSIQ